MKNQYYRLWKGVSMRCWYKILLVSISFFWPSYSASLTTCRGHLSADWYAQSAKSLRAQLDILDRESIQHYGNKKVTKIQAMVVPHAALAYSGSLAAACWRQVKNQHITRVIILASSHYVPFCGVLMPTCNSFTLASGWSLQVDRQCIHNLALRTKYFKQNSSSFQADTQCHKKLAAESQHTSTAYENFLVDPFNYDHALEMQLLFCSYYLPKAEIVPLFVGTLTIDDARMVAQYLKDCIDHTTLVVVSTDGLHYGAEYDFQPFPQGVGFKKNIQQLHNSVLQPVKKGSLEGFVKKVQDTQATICGKNPLMVLLALMEKKAFEGAVPHSIGYALSDPTMTKPSCVTYMGMVWGDAQQKKK